MIAYSDEIEPLCFVSARVNLVDHIQDSPLQLGEWHPIMVPLKLLNPESKTFDWFDIGDASGNGASTFSIDELKIMASDP